jgi:hypothetical protein
MTAVSVLVQDAMYAAQVLGQDQTPTSGDSQLVLRRLNRMLDSWSNEKQMIYANQTETFTMTANVGSYSTSLLTNGRPVAINGMKVTLSSLDYPVEFIDQLKWNAITYKDAPSIPRWCYYEPGYPNGTMNFYPEPYAAFVCSVDCQRVLSAPLLMATDLALPPGYEAAIVAGLAVDIWPSFKGKQPIPNDLKEDRRQTRSVLKRTNYTPMEMDTPFDNDRAGDISNSFPYRTF